MSELQELEKRLDGLLDRVFCESRSLWPEKKADAAWILTDGELQKNPIETNHFVVRHVSMDSYEIRDSIEMYKRDHKEFSYSDPINQELGNLLKPGVDVEFLPKINVAEKRFSYFDSLDFVRKNVKTFGEDAFGNEVGGYFVPQKIHKSDSVIYRDREDIAINYQLEQDSWGYVTLAERGKGQRDFVHPNFKDFVSPSIIFQPFSQDGKYGYKILEKLCNDFQKW